MRTAITERSAGAAMSGLGSSRAMLAALAVTWLLLGLAIVPQGNFPLNDDWVYALSVRSVLETGRFALPSPSTANVFAQIYWGALFCLPFGFSFTALRLSTFVLGGFGVLSTFLLLRELGAAKRLAALGALLLAANAVYLQLSVTFMTDVPFTALMAASLWLYVRGANRSSSASLAAAMAVTIAAIMIRQFALVLPLAFCVAHLVRRGLGLRSVAVAVIPVVAALALQVGYQHWLAAGGRTPLIVSPMASLIPDDLPRFLFVVRQMSVRALLYAGLYLAPFVAALAACDHRFSRAQWIWTAAIGAGLLLYLQWQATALPMVGNILMPFGLGPLTLADTFLVNRNLPSIARGLHIGWALATVWSAFAAAYLVVKMVVLASALPWRSISTGGHEFRRQAWAPAMLLTVVAGYTAGLFLIAYQSNWFDRYLLVLIPPVLGLLTLAVRDVALARVAVGAPLCAVYLLFAVLSVHDYLAWNRARWTALRSLEQQGVTARQIDGGYEYNGFYLNDNSYKPVRGHSYWWVADDEWMIASGPMAGYHEVAEYPFRRWLAGGQRGEIVTLQRDR